MKTKKVKLPHIYLNMISDDIQPAAKENILSSFFQETLPGLSA